MTEITIPESALSLLTVDGYCRRFFKVLIEKNCTHEAAFEAVETEYFEAFRQHKYTSFESFDVTKRRWKNRLSVEAVSKKK